MIASTPPVSANLRAAAGISKLPGTRTILMSCSRAPVRCKASRAPLSSRSVIKELNRLTTIPKRTPRASRSPEIPGGYSCNLPKIAVLIPPGNSTTNNRQFPCLWSARNLSFCLSSNWKIDSGSLTSSSRSVPSVPSGTSLAPARFILIRPSGTLNVAFCSASTGSNSRPRDSSTFTKDLNSAPVLTERPIWIAFTIRIMKCNREAETLHLKAYSVTSPPVRSLPLELRSALLQKRRCPLFFVFGGAAKTKERCFKIEPFGQGHLHSLIDRFHRELHGQRSVGNDLLRNSFSPRDEFGRRNHLIHQSHALRFLGADHFACKHQLHRSSLAY